jgi:hypothetical protein
LGRTGHPNLSDKFCQTGLNPDFYFSTFYIPNNKISLKLIKLKLLLFKKVNKQKRIEKKLKIWLLSLKTPAFGKENVWFPNSPNFEKFPDFRIGRDVR